MVSLQDVSNLQMQLKVLQDELSQNVVKLNSSENAKKSLEARLRNSEDCNKKIEASKVCKLFLCVSIINLLFVY